jgi:hypothetical protein
MIVGRHKMEKFFREAAGLNIDKNDLKRISDLVGRKLNDLLIVGVRNAGYNGRDIVMEPDLPLTKGFMESMKEFSALETELEIKPILEQLAAYPPLDLDLSVDVEEMLPDLTGALLIIMAHTMKIMEPKVTNPDTEMWKRVEKILDHTL